MIKPGRYLTKLRTSNSFRNFGQKRKFEDLGVIEHRRWNTMKVLDGWRPFECTDWKKPQGKTIKPKKLHNLLVTFDDLDKNEKVKGLPSDRGDSLFYCLAVPRSVPNTYLTKLNVFCA